MKLRYLNIEYFFKALNRPYYNSREFTKFVSDYFAGDELVGAEIGVNKGENAKNMLEMLNIKKLYLIDPFVENDLYGDWVDRTHTAVYSLQKYYPKIKFLFKTSKSATFYINERLDFVYIDGNHLYKHVKEDIELYWKKIRTPGILGGHDFSPNCPGVAKAVVEFAEKNNLPIYHNNGIDWWFVKE